MIRHRAETLEGVLVVVLYILTWQILAGLGYALQWYLAAVPPHTIHLGMLSKWEFWWFWDDYWIFIKYLDWPGIHGTKWAIRANAIGAILAWIFVLAAILITRQYRGDDSE